MAGHGNRISALEEGQQGLRDMLEALKGELTQQISAGEERSRADFLEASATLAEQVNRIERADRGKSVAGDGNNDAPSAEGAAPDRTRSTEPTRSSPSPDDRVCGFGGSQGAHGSAQQGPTVHQPQISRGLGGLLREPGGFHQHRQGPPAWREDFRHPRGADVGRGGNYHCRQPPAAWGEGEGSNGIGPGGQAGVRFPHRGGEAPAEDHWGRGPIAQGRGGAMEYGGGWNNPGWGQPPNFQEGRPPPQHRPPVQPRLTRMEFPKYKNGDPLEWIDRAEMFFEYQELPRHQWVHIASFHLEGETYQWLSWWRKQRPYPTWEEFCDGLIARFGPTEYEDFDMMLHKLKQTGTVNEYRKEFERLANRVHWTEKALLGCFMAGLKEKISDEVQAFQPRSIAQAIRMARLQEEKLGRRQATKTYRWSSKEGEQETVKGMIKGTSSTQPRKEAAVKRLSWEAMQERRAKGLCYTCDEKFVPGHKCKEIQVFMLQEEEGVETAGGRDSEEREVLDLEDIEVSVHALEGGGTTLHNAAGWEGGRSKGFHIGG
ncbi:hypothetical protein KSP39_PZI000635 [Platanthera zijinensis]|uniref:Retrotransposon gag domain-containing protein n=1 Tax=Platanthera zijinensis TaxID=2320716 RepID=A0AAP0C1X2_9ASPA